MLAAQAAGLWETFSAYAGSDFQGLQGRCLSALSYDLPSASTSDGSDRPILLQDSYLQCFAAVCRRIVCMEAWAQAAMSFAILSALDCTSEMSPTM